MKGLLAGLACLAVMALGAVGAFADGAGTQTSTVVFENASYTVPMPNPCSGAPGLTTFTYSGNIHLTLQADGTFWAHFVYHGDYAFTPFDPTQPSYLGHFRLWVGTNVNQQNMVEGATFHVDATGSDGSHLGFQEVMHQTVHDGNPPTVTVAFESARCV